LTACHNSLEPTYSCATEIVQTGPVAALLIIVIGVPLIKIAKVYLRRLFDRTEIDEGIENSSYRIAGVAMWAIVLLTAATELGINVTGIVAALGIIGPGGCLCSAGHYGGISSLAFSSSLTDRFGKENVSCCPRKSEVSTAAGVT
jgi:hypothetical protein